MQVDTLRHAVEYIQSLQSVLQEAEDSYPDNKNDQSPHQSCQSYPATTTSYGQYQPLAKYNQNISPLSCPPTPTTPSSFFTNDTESGYGSPPHHFTYPTPQQHSPLSPMYQTPHQHSIHSPIYQPPHQLSPNSPRVYPTQEQEHPSVFQTNHSPSYQPSRRSSTTLFPNNEDIHHLDDVEEDDILDAIAEWQES